MLIKRKSFLFIFSLAIIFAPYLAFGQWTIENPTGSNLPELTIGEVLINVTNWILGIVGTLAVLMLVWAGVRYVTAAGDESIIEEAKSIITQSVIGLVIVGISYSLVQLVVNNWIK